MAPDRITNAIDSLIAHIVPTDPNDTDEAAQERHDTCFELVKSILDRFATRPIIFHPV
jgi:gamma-tubulin complex component 3